MELFREFCLYETAVGGPDPQLPLVAKMVEDCDLRTRIWAGACYAAVYNVASAEALWLNLTPKGIDEMGATALVGWLSDHWDGLRTRLERRAVREPPKLARCLMGLASWVLGASWKGWGDAGYPLAWDSVTGLYSFGRYVSMKFLEYLRLQGIPGTTQPDLRLHGADSPREGLMLITGDPAWLMDERKDLASDERAAAELITGLGLAITPYEAQVLLCEFKQSLIGKRQYPGRSLDSELKYHWAIKPRWEHATSMFVARRAIFPMQSLGELHGWDGPREQLGGVAATYDYTWSDLLYDYTDSPDLAQPTRWLT